MDRSYEEHLNNRGNCNLTVEQVEAIREFEMVCRTYNVSAQHILAKMYDVSWGAIHNVLKGNSWRMVE